jgi:phospholipid transport system substrate-binding protein
MRRIARLLSALSLALALPALAAHDEVVKPLKVVVNSVRYGKDVAALKLFDKEEQAKQLLGDSYAKMTAAQKTEFEQLFETIFGKMAFPKIRENFKNLQAINYDEPKVEGNKATVNSTILILHPLKHEELKVTYSLAKEPDGWKVVDAVVLGDSMIDDARDNIQGIIKDGGIDGLLQTMRAKAKELESVQLK